MWAYPTWPAMSAQGEVSYAEYVVRVTIKSKQNQSSSSALIPSSPPQFPCCCFSVVCSYQLPPQGILHVEFGVQLLSLWNCCLPVLGCKFKRPPNISTIFLCKMSYVNKGLNISSKKNIPKEICNLKLPLSLLVYQPAKKDSLTCWDSWRHPFTHHQVSMHTQSHIKEFIVACR